MSHLLYWPTLTHFYPIGNTSAVCLTENLPPESKADILLLGCGDPRHILYTVYVDEGNPLSRARKLDVTCCDVDVAILARNTLLLTLLADDGVSNKLDIIWNIFYHMYIDQHALAMLSAQCRKLVSLAENVEMWRAGPYGHFIATCNTATLTGLRRVWTAYLDKSTASTTQTERFEQHVADGIQQVSLRASGINASAARSAGPLVLHTLQAVARQFDTYWSSGTTDNERTRRHGLSANPTFAISIDGDVFSVHYGTGPLSGFHLAEAFTSGKFLRQEEGIPTSGLVRVAKRQFRRWCTSTHARLKHHTLVIRLFAGDALAFSHALKHCQVMLTPVTPYNVAAWRLSTITLDEHSYGPNALSPAPLSFNVIDTSNMLDHVGLVNLLVVTAPLLRKTASATLYTEALLKKGDDPSQAILQHICGDLPTMGLLLGVVPSTLTSQITTRSNIHEIIMQGSKQYYERMAWKVIASEVQEDGAAPTPPVHLCFSPLGLAASLYIAYLFMFSEENSWMRFPLLFRSPERMLRELERSGVLHYNRRSFALLLHYVKTRLPTVNWSGMMREFETLVLSDDQLFVGKHAYHELCCQLHFLGVYTPEWMSHAIRDGVVFRDWRHVPQVITLVLVVPRSAIADLEPKFKDVGTPVLQCDLQDGPRQLWFAVTSATFGTLCVSGTGENRTCIITESDTHPPWRSKAPLIITFSVPARSVVDFGENAQATVGLTLRPTLAVTSKLGLNLTVFRTALTNAERVFLLAQRPVVGSGSARDLAGHWSECVGVFADQPSSSASEMPRRPGSKVHVDFCDETPTIQSFTARIDVTDPAACVALADTRTVPTVNSCSASTCSTRARLKIGAHTFDVRFPLPADIGRARLRVARRSSYIEIISPVAPLRVRPERYLSDRFGSSPDCTLALGSIHRIHLDRCPAFTLSDAAKFINWHDVHLSGMFSALERRRMCRRVDIARQIQLLGGGLHALDPDVLLDVKQTIQLILGTAAGSRTGTTTTAAAAAASDVFALVDGKRGPYLYVVVARMCLDLGSHTVVADAFVADATPAVWSALPQGRIAHVDTGTEEAAAWLQLVPRLAERCRTWSHKVTCVYRRPGSEPKSESESESDGARKSRMCACGEGIGAEVLPRRFKRVAPYLTRAALSPLFPVAYLEEEDVLPSIRVSAEPEKDEKKEAEAEAEAGAVVCRHDMDERASKPGAHTCGSCGKEGGLWTCSRCKGVRYCSKTCQRAAWKAHKKACRPAY